MTHLHALPNTSRQYRPRIHEYRKRLGLTQAQLAQRIGCSRETINKLENDRTYLTEVMEGLLAHHLQISPSERNHCFGFPEPALSPDRFDAKEAQSRRATLVALPRHAGQGPGR